MTGMKTVSKICTPDDYVHAVGVSRDNAVSVHTIASLMAGIASRNGLVSVPGVDINDFELVANGKYLGLWLRMGSTQSYMIVERLTSSPSPLTLKLLTRPNCDQEEQLLGVEEKDIIQDMIANKTTKTMPRTLRPNLNPRVSWNYLLFVCSIKANCFASNAMFKDLASSPAPK